MDAEQLTIPAVRQVVVAMRDGDRDAFFSAFTEDAVLTDDGNPQPLQSWAERELFTPHGRFDVEREEDGGLRLVGQYRSDQWEMPVFWNVQVRDEKISRLDLGAL